MKQILISDVCIVDHDNKKPRKRPPKRANANSENDCNTSYSCGSYQFVKFGLVVPDTERISSRPARKKPKIDEKAAPIIITHYCIRK